MRKAEKPTILLQWDESLLSQIALEQQFLSAQDDSRMTESIDYVRHAWVRVDKLRKVNPSAGAAYDQCVVKCNMSHPVSLAELRLCRQSCFQRLLSAASTFRAKTENVFLENNSQEPQK